MQFDNYFSLRECPRMHWVTRQGWILSHQGLANLRSLHIPCGLTLLSLQRCPGDAGLLLALGGHNCDNGDGCKQPPSSKTVAAVTTAWEPPSGMGFFLYGQRLGAPNSMRSFIYGREEGSAVLFV